MEEEEPVAKELLGTFSLRVLEFRPPLAEAPPDLEVPENLEPSKALRSEKCKPYLSEGSEHLCYPSILIADSHQARAPLEASNTRLDRLE